MDAASTLLAARRGAGLTQAALAGRAGTSQATISAYESGRKQPAVETLDRLLSTMGLRLTVESGARPAVRPSAAQLARSGRTLADVLLLAEALPTRHAPELRFPPLGGDRR